MLLKLFPFRLLYFTRTYTNDSSHHIFTAAEDSAIIDHVRQHGSAAWASLVRTKLPGRSYVAVRNRWRRRVMPDLKFRWEKNLLTQREWEALRVVGIVALRREANRISKANRTLKEKSAAKEQSVPTNISVSSHQDLIGKMVEQIITTKHNQRSGDGAEQWRPR